MVTRQAMSYITHPAGMITKATPEEIKKFKKPTVKIDMSESIKRRTLLKNKVLADERSLKKGTFKINIFINDKYHSMKDAVKVSRFGVDVLRNYCSKYKSFDCNGDSFRFEVKIIMSQKYKITFNDGTVGTGTAKQLEDQFDINRYRFSNIIKKQAGVAKLFFLEEITDS